MKLKNKKTGEIVDVESLTSIVPTLKADKNTIQLTGIDTNGYRKMYRYKSLADLNEEWEDASEEPKEYWYIDYDGGILLGETDDSSAEKMMKSIGNYFETVEEAEKAVEKLKAWKRLRDKGFRFTCFNACSVDYDIDEQFRKYISQDLDLLFGGEG